MVTIVLSRRVDSESFHLMKSELCYAEELDTRGNKAATSGVNSFPSDQLPELFLSPVDNLTSKMEPDRKDKFAIHEAAREGNGMSFLTETLISNANCSQFKSSSRS